MEPSLVLFSKSLVIVVADLVSGGFLTQFGCLFFETFGVFCDGFGVDFCVCPRWGLLFFVVVFFLLSSLFFILLSLLCLLNLSILFMIFVFFDNLRFEENSFLLLNLCIDFFPGGHEIVLFVESRKFSWTGHFFVVFNNCLIFLGIVPCGSHKGKNDQKFDYTLFEDSVGDLRFELISGSKTHRTEADNEHREEESQEA